MRHRSLAIVIPAYNEAGTIGDVVVQASCLGDVIVVDDGSCDATAQLSLAAGARVLRLRGNSGYEAALAAGVQAAVDAGYGFVMTMDADGQHDTASAQALVDTLGNADVVIGLRHQHQRVMEWVAGVVGSLLWQIPDPFSGLKLYRIETCRQCMPFDSRRLVGGEMFVRARRAGLKVVATPIVTRRRSDTPRFGTAIRANLRLARATVLLVAIYYGIVR